MTPTELNHRLATTKANIAKAGGKIVIKRGWFWVALHWIVFVVTFGTNRKFLTGYYTTLASIVGVPEGWKSRDIRERIAVLEHELVHIRQCKRLGLGHVWLGFPLYAILYLLVPMPFGFAYFRWRFEREAYAHGINVKLSFIDPARRAEHRGWLIDSAVKQMTTGRYGWTWPFPKRVRRYFEQHTCATVPPSHPNCRCVLVDIEPESKS